MSFKRFDTQDLIVSSDSITGTAWSTNNPSLTSFFTSSIQYNGPSGDYYLSIYDQNTALSNNSASVQFDIAYCDSGGSGSAPFNTLVEDRTPTRTNFGQYRNLILEDEYSEFFFGTETSLNIVTGSYFWAISVERSRYKEKLFKGTFNIKLSASGGELELTDNSNVVNVDTFLGSNRVYQIVSGSNGTPYETGSNGFSTSNGSYGLFLPDISVLLFNPQALSESIQLTASRTAGTDGDNPTILYDAIVQGGNFQLNSEETLSSDFVFVSLRNAEFNFSTNPSFISGSSGEVIYDNFVNNPQVYITTVGMYNDANELLATAKLSRPLLKDFTKEALIRVKLDF